MSERPNLSILIAIRNEESNLETLLENLKNQEYPIEKLEVILINDHSTDATENVYLAWKSNNRAENFIWINLEKQDSGKKKAIEKGIEKATGQFLLFTDADCKIQPDWVASMLACQQNSGAEMVCGQVVMDSITLVEKCQSIEFSSLIAVAASSLSFGKPTLCNAANFMVETKSILESKAMRKDENLASGDDVFLLHALHAMGKQIAFCRLEGAEIETQTLSNWPTFKSQRLRWASKWKNGLKGSNQWLAVLVWLFHLLFLSGLYLLANSRQLNTFLLFIGLKAVAETFFLIPFNKQKTYSRNIGEIWFMQIPYSLYVLYFGLLVLFSSRYQWKDRTFQY